MSIPAGWYDDGHGAQRWWDGQTWTEHVRPVDAATPAEPEAPAEPAAPVEPEAPTEVYEPAAPTQAYPPVTPEYPPTAPTQAYPPYATAAPASTAPAPGAQAYPPAAPTGSSKKWVLWLVGGLVALMILGGALFFVVTSLLGSVLNSGSPLPAVTSGPIGPTSEPGPTSDPGPTEPAPDAEITELTDAERAAAEEVVNRYDAIWSGGVCNDILTITTDAFREGIGFTDCYAFEEQTAEFTESVSDYAITFIDGYRVGDLIIVETRETGNFTRDDAGEPLETPEPFDFRYEYQLVDQSGMLRIDSIGDIS